MAGRPRTITDEQIMAAVGEAVGRVGPGRLTLADVARAAGVSTGALVQRYGSKRNLLLAFSGRAAGVAGQMRAAYDDAPDPVEGLLRAVTLGADATATPEQFANHLAFLHLELADPEFRALLADYAAAVRAEIEHYLTDARDRGLLRGDVHRLAAATDAVRNGTRITWAMRRDGSLADALRRDVRTLLQPYLTKGELP